MPSLNFSVFVDKVESGEKPLTIRDIGKRTITPGQMLYLFTGMRTRYCKPIMVLNNGVSNALPCLAVLDIRFGDDPKYVCYRHFGYAPWFWLDDNEITDLAILDGFQGMQDFYDYHYNRKGDHWQVKRLYVFNQIRPGAFLDEIVCHAPHEVAVRMGIVPA